MKILSLYSWKEKVCPIKRFFNKLNCSIVLMKYLYKRKAIFMPHHDFNLEMCNLAPFNWIFSLISDEKSLLLNRPRPQLYLYKPNSFSLKLIYRKKWKFSFFAYFSAWHSRTGPKFHMITMIWIWAALNCQNLKKIQHGKT